MMSANFDSCSGSIIHFLERIIGRLSFKEVEKLFSKALDENPVFASIRHEGALGKNIIVLLGGRGCGKTLALRYFKHSLSKDGWDFIYVDGSQLKGNESSNPLKQIIKEIENKLRQDSDYKVVIAIDDVVEANELARECLKYEASSLVHKYAGRVKLILAMQSERVTAEGVATIQLLKTVLGQAPNAEMFFGERPVEVIEDSFKSSYICRDLVALFRGAAIVNLDAYWSSFRSLNDVPRLANVIIDIMKFYVSNIDSKCNVMVNEVDKHKHGLALLALSSLPKVADPAERIIIEYAGRVHRNLDWPISALNGLGIAELLLRFFSDEKVRKLAEKAEKIYSYLSSIKVENISVEDVKKIIFDATSEVLCDIGVNAVQNQKISALGLPLPQEAGEGRRRKYGPKIDIIAVRRRRAGREELTFLVLHDLRIDSRGYISSSSRNKLKKLIEMGVPSESELRYLVIIASSKKHAESILSDAGIIRIGRDIVVLLADKLSNADRSFISLLHQLRSGAREIKSLNLEIDEEIRRIMYKIVIGTVLLNLRDLNDLPQLMYYLLPAIA